MVNFVKMNRKLTHGIEMEVRLKDGYAKICGKDRRRNDEGELSGYYVSDDESLEAYDGFAGDDDGLAGEDVYTGVVRTSA